MVVAVIYSTSLEHTVKVGLQETQKVLPVKNYFEFISLLWILMADSPPGPPVPQPRGQFRPKSPWQSFSTCYKLLWSKRVCIGWKWSLENGMFCHDIAQNPMVSQFRKVLPDFFDFFVLILLLAQVWAHVEIDIFPICFTLLESMITRVSTVQIW